MVASEKKGHIKVEAEANLNWEDAAVFIDHLKHNPFGVTFKISIGDQEFEV